MMRMEVFQSLDCTKCVALRRIEGNTVGQIGIFLTPTTEPFKRIMPLCVSICTKCRMEKWELRLIGVTAGAFCANLRLDHLPICL